MKFSALPIGKFFIHKDAAELYYGWRKFNCLSARKVTKTGVTYGEPVAFDLAEETLLYEGDLTVDPWEHWEREVRHELVAR